MACAIDVNMNDFLDKEFHTFRKTKNINEIQYSTKYSFVNLVNQHFVRGSNNALDEVIFFL